MKLLQMVTGEPQRTPSPVRLGDLDCFFLTSGSPGFVLTRNLPGTAQECAGDQQDFPRPGSDRGSDGQGFKTTSGPITPTASHNAGADGLKLTKLTRDVPGWKP